MDRHEGLAAIIGDLYAQIDALVGQLNTANADLATRTVERDALQTQLDEIEAKNPSRKRTPIREQKI